MQALHPLGVPTTCQWSVTMYIYIYQYPQLEWSKEHLNTYRSCMFPDSRRVVPLLFFDDVTTYFWGFLQLGWSPLTCPWMFQVPRICCGRCGNGHVMASPAGRFRFLGVYGVRCPVRKVYMHMFEIVRCEKLGGICRAQHYTCDWKIGHRMFLTYWHSHLCDEKH